MSARLWLAALAIVAVAVLSDSQGPAPSVFHAAAQEGPTTTLDDQEELALTVYNSDIALVRDVRNLTLARGVVVVVQVVEADDGVAASEQGGGGVAADEARCAGDQDGSGSAHRPEASTGSSAVMPLDFMNSWNRGSLLVSSSAGLPEATILPLCRR